MRGFYQLVDHRIIDQLGWTLVHFLWQGTAVAALNGLSQVVLRQLSSNARYCLGCCALLLMLACPITTFIVMGGHQATRELPSTDVNPIRSGLSDLDATQSTIVAHPGMTQQVWWGSGTESENFVRGFVLIWLVGVWALSSRLLLASFQVSRL